MQCTFRDTGGRKRETTDKETLKKKKNIYVSFLLIILIF